MLDFLEDQNPLIRNSSKNWLLESMISFQRVIDPILEILLLSKMGQWDQKNKQYFYTQVYETRITNEAFRKLKSVLLNAGENFIM
jgi:hypothetical protein